MSRLGFAGFLACGAALAGLAAYGQSATVRMAPPTVLPETASPAPAAPPQSGAPDSVAPGPEISVPGISAPQPSPPSGGSALLLRGLDKVTGHPTDIVAPIGRPVQYATLTITARFCYSTPASETPETTAFVQIDDHRPDQNARKVFSGWMYASSPGLNPMDHPTYDVWVISCNNVGTPPPAVTASTAPVKVLSPDSSDKEGLTAVPEDAGQ